MTAPADSSGPARQAPAAPPPPFRLLPQKRPSVEHWKGEDGAIYIRQTHAPGPRPRSVPHALEARAAEHPERPFLKERSGPDGAWHAVSYGEAWERVQRLGAGLKARGCGPGRGLMILSGNSVDTALLILAGQAIGAPVAPISVAYSLMSKDHEKLRHCTAAVAPAAVFAAQGGAFGPALDAVLQAADGTVAVITGDGARGEPLSALEADGDGGAVAAMDALTDATVAKILFTSGSTGLPKPVPQTQGMMCSMIAGQEGLRDDARDPDYDPDEVVQFLDWLPWNHISGSNVNFNGILWRGGTFWIDGGKPSSALFKQTMDNIRDCRPHTFGTAPIALSMLADAMEADPSLRAAFFANMQQIGYGGATLSDDLYGRLQALAVEETGRRIPIVTMYGATETQGITVVHWEAERVGLLGLPLPGLTLKLVPSGSKMEVRVKGPTVMDGYLGMPEKTRNVFDAEGFYCLGDAARLADPEDPRMGVEFDGRIGEDFKLSTGTWVSVGTLRPDLVAACSPLAMDAVICGQDKDYVAALIFPAQEALQSYMDQCDNDEKRCRAAYEAALEHNIAKFNEAQTGSSRRIGRFKVLDKPPSIDDGEITDKGYLNQRLIQELRPYSVDSLFANPLPGDVIEPRPRGINVSTRKAVYTD